MKSSYSFKFITSIEQIGKASWDNLAEGASPFCQYSFLHALEISQSVGGESGWYPQHLIIYQQGEIVGVLPLYKKSHSYGEYVFDFAWANTYKQYGLNYYPKLVSAIPFTPVTGVRLILKAGIDRADIIKPLIEAVNQHIALNGMSSMHWLFVEEQVSQLLSQNDLPARRSVQFQWFNRQYSSFEHYLSHFNSRKRKSVKKERARIVDAGVKVVRLYGESLSESHLQFFYTCYKQTYLKRSGHHGYLTESFFKQIFATMRNNLMLVIASIDETKVASALFVYDKNQLCGRYWGTLQDLESLHFECCYYQGIEFCIEHNIAEFNPGTQGEHKILRGFEPIYCYSNHLLKEHAFHDAVGRFIEQENVNINEYKASAERLLPFKQQE